MTKKTTNYRSSCTISMSMDIIGDKWSLLIMRDMLLHRKSTVKEFLNSGEKIATNILTQRLKYLLENGLILKINTRGTIKSAVYIVSEYGKTTLPILIELNILGFGLRSDETVLSDQQSYFEKEIMKDKFQFMENTLEKYNEFARHIQNSVPQNLK